MVNKVKNTIPVYDIQSLQEVENREKPIIALPFAQYLEIHPNLHTAHRHTFYHIVLFTKGGGHHSIDFEEFPVADGQIYFMAPGQVHSWSFEGDIDGYIVNFSPSLLQSFLADQDYPDRFPFMQGNAKDSVIQLSGTALDEVVACFRHIIAEAGNGPSMAGDMICAQLIILLILVNRHCPAQPARPSGSYVTLSNFRKLVNAHFATMRLPKEYAAMLYITPNHLNAICNDLLGQPAGEVIRDRVLLEAKRLLVNVEISISEIAYRLSFADNSYFTKFFKKYTGITPEEFRKKHL